MKNVETNQMNARRCNSEGAGVKMTSWLNNNFKLLALTLLAMLSSNVVWGEDWSLSYTDFNTTSYAANDGDHTKSGITYNCFDVYQNASKMQFRSNSGCIYNKTAMPGNITKITLSTPTNFAIKVGTSVNPSSGTSVTSGSAISGSNKYFYIKAGSSTPKTATITIEYSTATALTTMAEVIDGAKEGSTMSIAIDNWVVTGVNGNYAYIADKNNEKGITIYKSGHGFTKGNILNGTVSGVTSQYYYSVLPELTNLTKNYSGLTVTTGGSVTPKAVTFSDLTDVERIGTVVTLSNVIYSDEYETLEDPNDRDNNWIYAGNDLYSDASWIGEELYNTTGVYAWTISSGTYLRHIYPRSAADIVPAKTISSIAVTTSPKTSYTTCETLVVNDWVVTATYSDTSTGDVTSGCTFSPANGSALTAGSQTVTVTHTASGKTTTKTVTVTQGAKDTFVDNVQGTADQYGECNGYTIPSCGDKTKGAGCDGEHYKFIGWSSTQIPAGTQPTEPDGLLKAGETHDATGIPYYAVWAKEAE